MVKRPEEMLTLELRDALRVCADKLLTEYRTWAEAAPEAKALGVVLPYNSQLNDEINGIRIWIARVMTDGNYQPKDFIVEARRLGIELPWASGEEPPDWRTWVDDPRHPCHGDTDRSPSMPLPRATVIRKR